MDINEVRERVSVLADWAVIGREHGDALRALLADHARLQSDASPKGDSTNAKDAARYRFLRDNNGVRNHLAVEVFIDGEAFAPGHLDAQVDDAMQANSAEVQP